TDCVPQAASPAIQSCVLLFSEMARDCRPDRAPTANDWSVRPHSKMLRDRLDLPHHRIADPTRTQPTVHDARKIWCLSLKAKAFGAGVLEHAQAAASSPHSLPRSHHQWLCLARDYDDEPAIPER